MTAAIAIVLAALAQEAGSLGAVSRLVDRAATARGEVEAAAARMPAGFHRTVLQEELKSRPTTLKRVSFDLKEQAATGVFNEIASKFGEKINLQHFQRGGPGGGAQATVALKLENASFMEALDAACRQAKVGVFTNGLQLALNPWQENLASSPYRNHLVVLSTATRSRKIEFGAGETRSVVLALNLFWDADGGVVRVGKVRLAEAIDDQGRPVAAQPEEPAPAPPERKEGDPVVHWINRWSQQPLALQVPDAPKLSRVRGFYEVHVSQVSSNFELGDLEKGPAKSDDHYEVQATRKKEFGPGGILLRMKPKGSLEEFLKTPVEVFGSGEALLEAPVGEGATATVRDRAEVPVYAQGRVVDGAVEYRLIASGLPADTPAEYKSLRIRIHRATVERLIPFEFSDVPIR